MRKRHLAVTALLAWAALLTQPAEAHGHLQKATPGSDETVKTAPSEIRLWFSEPLEPAFSAIEVDDASGASVTSGKAAVDPSAPKQLTLPLPELQPGTYTVKWRVLSIDTHKTDGTYTFQITP